MSIRRIAIPQSVVLLLVVLFGAGLFSNAGTTAAPVGGVSSGKPRPTATPTAIPTPTATPTPRCTATGSVIPSPNGNDYNNSLNDVVAISASDIWAVGSYGTPLEHWDGASWSLVPDPNAGGGTRLFGVAAVTSANVWAVGATIAPQGWDLALAEHWDGTTWSVIPGTTVGTSSKLSDVTALAANDVWAVGSYASPATNNWYQPLIEHWDGTAWSVVPSPSIGTSSELHGVAALAPNDIWAVGDTYTTQYQTLVLHWNGANWTRVSSPNVGPYGNALYRVSALAANDIWAVGTANNSGSTLILHWDGARWSVIPSPNSANPYNILLDVAAISSQDIWAVGYSEYSIPVGEDFEYHDLALLLHWDGAHWSLVASAQPNTSDNRRNGVTTLPDGTAWVVGWYDQSTAPYQATLVERYVCQ
jgi:hypothetical protein